MSTSAWVDWTGSSAGTWLACTTVMAVALAPDEFDDEPDP